MKPLLHLRVLGGSWVVISRNISRETILITHMRGLITPLITTHEPPSSGGTTSWADEARQLGGGSASAKVLLLLALGNSP